MKHLKKINNKDIIITLPSKIEWSDYQKELELVKDEKNVLNFKVPFLPKYTSIGSKCYLCYRSNIIGWMKITGLINKNFICSTTNKKWDGNFIQRSGLFYKLDNPIPMKGFQGFKYF